MNVLEAAVQVLKEAGSPLHVKEITNRILANGLWSAKGKTPEATVHARLAVDVKKKGTSSAFVRVAPATFALSEHAEKIPKSKHVSKLKPSKTSTYSFTDAAEKILDQHGGKKPMHYRSITEKALEHSWLDTAGKTPEATMYAQIITEIKRNQKRGKQPRFAMHGKGYVGLTKWMGHGLAFEIEQHNAQVRKALHKRLFNLTSDGFEELIAQLLAEVGFEKIEVTSKSKDGGIDVRGVLVVGDVISTRMAIQAKKWKHNVQAPVVQQVRGSLGAHEQGLIITTSDFSPGARKEAERPDATPVAIMNGEQLAMLLMAYGIGVSRSTAALFDLDSTISFLKEV